MVIIILHLSVLAALVGMLVLVADGAGGFELASQIGFYGRTGLALSAQDYLHVPLVKDIHGAAAHTAGDDDLHAHIRQKVGQKTGTVAGIWDGALGFDEAVLRLIDHEILTVAEVGPDLAAVTGNSLAICGEFSPISIPLVSFSPNISI